MDRKFEHRNFTIDIPRLLVIRSQRGVSLPEVMVVVAISSLIVVAAFTTYTGSYQQYKTAETKSLLSQDVLLLSNYLSKILQEIGGGSTRVWEALWIEDNASCTNRAPFGPCNGTDRVNLAILTFPELECPVTGLSGGNVYALNNNPTCCITAALLGKQVMFTLNGMWAQKYVSAVDVNNCKVTVTPGQMNLADSDAALPPLTGFTGGVMSQVDVQTLFVDSVNHQLKSWVDANNDNVMDATEVSLLADQVYDFQISLGYDFNPADGTLTDTGNNVDEYTNNAPGANDVQGVGFFLNATPDQLRMIEFGVVLGTPFAVAGSGNQVQLLNGAAVSNPNSYLQSITTKIAPRNLGVFQ